MSWRNAAPSAYIVIDRLPGNMRDREVSVNEYSTELSSLENATITVCLFQIYRPHPQENCTS